MNKILIIEDDIQLTFFMQTVLKNEGYEVKAVNNGNDGIKIFSNNSFDLILLDVQLPDINGLEICKKIRIKSDIPIIFFSAQDEVHEKVEGLDSGANDYITKPIEVNELLARVRANIRSLNKIKNQEKFSIHDLEIDINIREARIGDTQIKLAPKEFEILLFFLKNPNKTLTKQQIFESVWQEDFNKNSDKRLIDEHVNKLRKKLRITERKFIQTIYGIGYIIK